MLNFNLSQQQEMVPPWRHVLLWTTLCNSPLSHPMVPSLQIWAQSILRFLWLVPLLLTLKLIVVNLLALQIPLLA